MKILITGAAGFIGSNLTLALLKRGYSVIGLDNLSQGRMDHLAACRDDPRFKFVQGDVRDGAAVREQVGAADAVFHLAAYKIPRYGNAMDTLRINTHGTRQILEAAAQRGCRVIFASTSDCYGRNPHIPFHEHSDLWMGPSTVKRWAYAISKMYDEHLCHALMDEKKLRFTVVRFFGGYGPHQHLSWWGGPQSVFIDAALRGHPMDIHGDGQQTRSFTYIDDHVNGLILCLEREEACHQVFNLGNTREISIQDLALLVWRLAGSGEPQLKRISYRSFGKYEDVMRRVPDISKARALLGFEPKTDLEEGLRVTIDWQRRVTRDLPRKEPA
ncbi:MAG: GDP-mannose 4,6-dehydratase [Kiritimatiellae bacterium]|nr:GDP-mannose 4,6-dehydratase [Kiritimatiellia bacterium]